MDAASKRAPGTFPSVNGPFGTESELATARGQRLRQWRRQQQRCCHSGPAPGAEPGCEEGGWAELGTGQLRGWWVRGWKSRWVEGVPSRPRWCSLSAERIPEPSAKRKAKSPALLDLTS